MRELKEFGSDAIEEAMKESMGAELLINDKLWAVIKKRAEARIESALHEFCHRPVQELTPEVVIEFRATIKKYKYELLRDIEMSAQNAEYFHSELVARNSGITGP